MTFDHVAINVADVARAVAWYQERVDATVLYQDATWAFLDAGGTRIALTLSSQHPRHLAFDVGPEPDAEFLRSAKRHRDGSISKYEVDPDGNAVEWIYYPEGAAVRSLQAEQGARPAP
jgi:catechol 2,3-dioxygenase-like lactoylglutathione lyase family enzyme